MKSGAKQNKWCGRSSQPLCNSCWDGWHSEAKSTRKKPSEDNLEAFRQGLIRSLAVKLGVKSDLDAESRTFGDIRGITKRQISKNSRRNITYRGQVS